MSTGWPGEPSTVLFIALVLATGLERVAELVVSTRNARWSFARGGVESGRAHFPPMVALHTGLLLACLVEFLAADRHFTPALGWPMLALVAASEGLRWWCIATLGVRWNTRVIVVPGLQLVARGPYRWLKHPNYVAVVVEGFALPLVGSCWWTALGFSVLNAVLLLRFRLPAENRALAGLPPAASTAPPAGTGPR
ncbi:isoprenylcysteine carboxyl methyltransferase family protein [Kineococcus rhizosphaerae]|uniref:Alkylresorcinol O-methyltransferase n=1 Tax=Kineococcus rhizosphaerae TaxID=559628 RepID=A0A2T0RA62_9ACTN|nr:isoprenylcysteine carboxylmethyltransferase family protein [Kineococcus rhizosphaerae]PRY18044.1 alkylresorcinol O-methyltransferase [Kineococcus rhizosphaerae]